MHEVCGPSSAVLRPWTSVPTTSLETEMHIVCCGCRDGAGVGVWESKELMRTRGTEVVGVGETEGESEEQTWWRRRSRPLLRPDGLDQ